MTVELKKDFEIYGSILARYHGQERSVIVPEGITCIEQSAFYSCNELEEVFLPKSLVRIERSAFAECHNLRSVVIQPGLDTIGDTAFENCQKLTDIELPLSLQYIGRMAFAKCISLQKIKIPKNVTRLNYGIFMADTGLERVELPLYLSSIGECAFYFCKNLKEVYVPESIDGIHPDTFYGCTGLKSGYIPKIILDYYRREEQFVFTIVYLSGKGRYTGWEDAMYNNFINEHKTELCEKIMEADSHDAMDGLLKKNILNQSDMEQWIEKSRRSGNVEFTARLLKLKSEFFEETTDMWDI